MIIRPYKAPPNAIKEIKGKLVLKKGTRIVLGGENDSEMSNAIGVSKSTYTSSKNGKGFSGSGTSGMGVAWDIQVIMESQAITLALMAQVKWSKWHFW
ncbi:hypothetical protein JP0021_11210 [Helicobacter pylori]